MTPNPNPSPELIERLGTRLTAHLSRDRRDDRNWPLVIDAGDLAEIVAVFSQTLPAPVSHASHTTGVVSHVDGIGDSQPLPAPGEVGAGARNLYLLQGDNARMAEALRQCRDQFAFYAREHYAAGKSEKGDTNTRFADIANKALTAVKPATVAAANDEGVAELRDLEANATRGEWSVAEGSVEDGSIYIDADDTGDRPVAMIMSGSPHNQDRADAAFIVAAVAFARAAIRLLSQGGGK